MLLRIDTEPNLLLRRVLGNEPVGVVRGVGHDGREGEHLERRKGPCIVSR